MILWCDGAHDAGENMRRDAALLKAAEAGTPPVLRLFRFAPAGITLGRSQDPARELDLARCAADGVAWARRPTGGRAIFHAQEWTYALAAPRDHPCWGGSLAETYARASGLILRSLMRLGVPVALVGRRAATPAPTPPQGAEFAALASVPPSDRVPVAAAPRPLGCPGPAAPCFASTARHELVLGEGKLAGSAQRRTARAILQQGSILLGPGHVRLAEYLRLPPESRALVRETLRLATTSAAPWLGGEPALERWADALQAELGPRVRRLDGAAGLFLLTARASGSYTAPAA